MTEAKQTLINDEQAQMIGRAAAQGLGMWIMWRGVRRPGLFGGILAVAGAALAFPKAAQQVCEFIESLDLGKHMGLSNEGSQQRSDESSQAETAQGAGTPIAPSAAVAPLQEPVDEVDEVGMESFPASDPPASYHSTGGR